MYRPVASLTFRCTSQLYNFRQRFSLRRERRPDPASNILGQCADRINCSCNVTGGDGDGLMTQQIAQCEGGPTGHGSKCCHGVPAVVWSRIRKPSSRHEPSPKCVI